jgi:RNA polymerase primary sigma factor
MTKQLLTFEQEKELARRLNEHGDEDAFEKLVTANLGLVVYVVQKVPSWNMNGALTRDDMIQEGNIALMRAARTWVPEQRFATYARKLIYSSVMRAIENTALMIHIPVPVQEEIRKIKKAESKLTQQHGREPTVEELAAESRIPLARVRDRLHVNQRQPVSLDVYKRDNLTEEDHE